MKPLNIIFMTKTYSQINLHIVFAVKFREKLIDVSWEDKLYKYITGIVSLKNQKMLAINGVSDHIHIFISIVPSCSISDLVREIKKSSTQFVNSNGFCNKHFHWQEGYGVFSHHRNSTSKVVNYISNQKIHHGIETYEEEFIKTLKEHGVDYDMQYTFDSRDDD
jgi:REP element-mobilizing transposase RayT